MHGSRRSTDQIGFGPFVDVRAGELRKGSSRLRSAGLRVPKILISPLPEILITCR